MTRERRRNLFATDAYLDVACPFSVQLGTRTDKYEGVTYDGLRLVKIMNVEHRFPNFIVSS